MNSQHEKQTDLPQLAQLTAFIDQNWDNLVDSLREWLSIPSISSQPEHGADVRTAADWAQEYLKKIGFPQCSIIETAGHPLISGFWKMNESAPTLLIYGHYDVQPTDPLDEWQTPPFSPDIRDGKMYCRGASDDKGQVFLVLAALQAWAKVQGAPPLNIRVLLEGEEEAGGEAISLYVREHGDELAADSVLICDTAMISPTQPSLITGLRGILYTELAMNGARHDLHSGSYGGVAPNPLHGLCLLLTRLKGEDGRINIPELQAAIHPPDAEEKRFWDEDPLKIAAELAREMGVTELVGENEFAPLERLGVRPTLEIHGILGGYTGAGAKTVIPASATAKLSMRLPAGLSPQTVFSWLEKAVYRACPAGYTVKLHNLHSGDGVAVSKENSAIQAASRALRTVYGVDPIFMREGGSIPIAALFTSTLNAPVVLMGFGLPDDNIHAPNENLSLEQLRKGMKTVAAFFGYLARG